MLRIILTILICVIAGGAFGALLGRVYIDQPVFYPATLVIITVFGICLSLVLLGLAWLRQEKHRATQFQLTSANNECLKLQLKEAEQRFDTLFELRNTGIALLNLDGHILKINNSFCELFGYSLEDLVRMNFFHLIHPNDYNHLQIHLERMLSKEIRTYQSEQQCYRKNGDSIWLATALTLIHDALDKPAYFIVQAQNISLQKRAEERLSHMAYHDPLTGLANRNKLEQFIAHMLASAKRHNQIFALLFLDLDRFKNINDSIGHEAGDSLLQIVAERLRGMVRSTDMVARLGGDEFVVVITDVKKSESVAVIAQKILEHVLKVIMIKGEEIYITTSIGISLYPYDGQNLATLMKNADLSLYRAKEHGRNNYQFFTLEMTGKAQTRLGLQNALTNALVKNEFVLHYQPKMELKTRRIIGVEVLLRWKNHEHGAVSSEEIITLAEETGLIIPISAWILKTACQQLKVWHTMGFSSLSLAVNCSPQQFKLASFVDEIVQTLAKMEIAPQALELEIPESALFHEQENTLRTLHAIKAAGLRVVIDHFGTGYWSLSNLRQLSVDKIKIDKSFIKQLADDHTSTTITSAIIVMLKRLKIYSMAEGVENRTQYDFLKKEGCDEIQGYYLTQPLNADEMTYYLQHPMPDAEVISANKITTTDESKS